MTVVDVDQERLGDFLDRMDVVGLRRPIVGGAVPTDVPRTLTWTPDLSPAELLLARAVGSAVRLTVAERNALESDIDGLRQYQNLASPTLAQTVLAVKAQSRILRALLRD